MLKRYFSPQINRKNVIFFLSLILSIFKESLLEDFQGNVFFFNVNKVIKTNLDLRALIAAGFGIKY